jgi:hypothetical protein
MGTPVQAGEPAAGEPELVALARIAGQERAGLPPDVTRAFPQQVAV